MELQNKHLTSILQTVGIIPNGERNEIEKALMHLQNGSYTWQVEDIDLALIRGYYQADGREVDQVIQTPFNNYCITKIGNKYELFQIGVSYRPIVVSFNEHIEIKQWFEKELGISVIKN